MRTQDLNRDRHLNPLRPACRIGWFADLLLVGAILVIARSAPGQSAQSSPAANQDQQSSAQQNSSAPAQPAAPMVMGENPDSTQDSASPAPSSTSNAPAASSAPGTLTRQPASHAKSRSTPSAPADAFPQPAAAVAAPPIAIPAPADAGGNKARQAINDDCVSLFKMANDLKAAVDKTNQDELSVAVVRKADQIEQLAHRVKDEMKPATGRE